jgi:transposase-like protein
MIMDMYHFNQIPSEAQIRKYIRRIVFGKNIYCPACKTDKVYGTGKRYRCRKCRRRFSLLSHTWLSNLKLSLPEFWLVLWCWTIQIPVKQAMKFSRLSELTIRHWYDEFRHHLPEDEEVLEHLVQLDEAYFGGKKGRALFLGKQIGSRKLAWKLLPHSNPAREHAWYYLQECVAPNTVLNTDGAGIYKGIDNWWPIYHNYDIHKKWEFELTSEIGGMFGVLRTFIRRMYHHVTVDKLPEFIGEFCYRFSHPEIFENPHYYLEKSLFLVPTR